MSHSHTGTALVVLAMTVNSPSVRVREISCPDAMARLSCSKSLGDKRFTRQIPPHRHTSRRFPGTGFPSCRQLRFVISAHLSALPQWIWTGTPPAPRRAPWRPPPGPWFSLASHRTSIPIAQCGLGRFIGEEYSFSEFPVYRIPRKIVYCVLGNWIKRFSI